jgi:hypothetical protein
MRIALRVLAALLAMTAPAASFAQGIDLTPGRLLPLTDKLTNLQGTWKEDPTRGVGSICGVRPYDAISFKVSPTEIAIDAGLWNAVLPLDGRDTRLSDGRVARATLDAGWLKITMTRERPWASTLVMRETYIVLRGTLTIWRTLNGVFPDGTEGKIDCGNHHAIVYSR